MLKKSSLLTNKRLRWYGTPSYYGVLPIEINYKISYIFITFSFPKIVTKERSTMIRTLTTNVSQEFESRWGFYDMYLSKNLKTNILLV